MHEIRLGRLRTNDDLWQPHRFVSPKKGKGETRYHGQTRIPDSSTLPLEKGPHMLWVMRESKLNWFLT